MPGECLPKREDKRSDWAICRSGTLGTPNRLNDDLQQPDKEALARAGSYRKDCPTRASMASWRGMLGWAPASVQASEPAASPRCRAPEKP